MHVHVQMPNAQASKTERPNAEDLAVFLKN